MRASHAPRRRRQAGGFHPAPMLDSRAPPSPPLPPHAWSGARPYLRLYPAATPRRFAVSDPDNIVYLRDHAAALEPPARAPAASDGTGGERPRQTEAEEDPARAHPHRPRCPGRRLDVFGMMMAVAADLPDLENRQIYHGARNSMILDVNGRRIGLITGKPEPGARRLQPISPTMRNAIIAIEDRRFYENRGIDFRGIGRALVPGRAQQELGPGRLDDRPAVRQERAPGPAEADHLREAARGRARLPPDAQVEQAEDPHRVPELDLLRQRRLRHGVGRAHVLRRKDGVDGVRQAHGLPRYCAKRCDPAQAALLAGRGRVAGRL